MQILGHAMYQIWCVLPRSHLLVNVPVREGGISGGSGSRGEIISNQVYPHCDSLQPQIVNLLGLPRKTGGSSSTTVSGLTALWCQHESAALARFSILRELSWPRVRE
eukprot:g41500.t1